MTKVFALVPAKVTLFGEHAVVYGYPAIAASIPTYLRIEASFRGRGGSIARFEGVELRIPVKALGIGFDFAEIDKSYASRLAAYISKALELCSEVVGGLDSGLEISVESPLPPSIGLGTSAAVSAGVLACCAKLHGVDLGVEELASLAWRVEKEVQGAASPMDTATVCLGGIRLIEPSQRRYPLLRDSLEALVGYVPRVGTTASLVAMVKNLMGRAPSVFRAVMEGISEVVKASIEAIKQGNLELLGLLASVNHGLLRALGVVSEASDRVVHALREAGAYGAKMSGAGGGGAFIAFADPRKLEVLSEVVRALGAKVVSLKIGCPGISLGESP